MANVPDRATFENLYAGKAPWDIGRPQKQFVDIADQVKGAVLDAGCGTGDNAIYFASHARSVTGIDFLPGPIARAQQKATERGVRVNFLVWNALELFKLPDQFDSVIDSGLFHVFNDDDRARYVAGLAHVLKSGGKLFLLCFSDEEPGEQGPRRISRAAVQAAFAQGWRIQSLAPARFETNPDFKEMAFSEGGPKAWFAIVERV